MFAYWYFQITILWTKIYLNTLYLYSLLLNFSIFLYHLLNQSIFSSLIDNVTINFEFYSPIKKVALEKISLKVLQKNFHQNYADLMIHSLLILTDLHMFLSFFSLIAEDTGEYLLYVVCSGVFCSVFLTWKLEFIM